MPSRNRPATILLVAAVLPWAGCAPETPEAYRHGLACLDRDDLDGAIACFDEALRAAPALADAHYQRGLAFFRRGQAHHKGRDLDAALLDNDRAIFECAAALGLRRSHAAAATLRKSALANGELYKREFDLDEAVRRADEAVRAAPDKAEAYDRRGCDYVARADFYDSPADYQRALDDFAEAARLRPDYVQAWYNRATVLMVRGQQLHGAADRAAAQGETAQEDYRRAVGYYDRAIDDFRRAAALDPAVAAARGAGDDAHRYPEDDEDLLTTPYDLEVPDFEPSRIVCPRMARAHYLRGDALLKLGEPGRAVSDLTEAIRLFPRFAEAHANRALAHQALGRLKEAQADQTKARRLGSSFD